MVYGRPAGADGLREAIAEMQQVPVEAVQIVTGASEAIVVLMWLAAEPGANVILPLPGFTTFSALPNRWASKPAFIACAARTASASIPTRFGSSRIQKPSSSSSTARITPVAQPSRRRNGIPARLHRRARHPAYK